MQVEPAERFPISVVVERRRIDNPWQDHSWRAVAILPGRTDVAPWTRIEQGPDFVRFLAGTADLELFRGETETYKYNLESPAPAVYVVLRHVDREPGLELFEATVCPGEAHAHADTGGDLVEAVAMPQPVLDWLADFVARHHVEKTHYKRTRDKADPEALGVRRRRDQGGRDD